MKSARSSGSMSSHEVSIPMNRVLKDLDYYLALEYPYTVVPDDGSFFVQYPDLPGCMTQVEDAADIPAMALEIKELWLETALEGGFDIPEPVTAEFSGKFVVRLPRSLHQLLAHRAGQEGLSLNSYVVHLLGERSATIAIQQELAEPLSAMSERMTAISATGAYDVDLPKAEDELSARRQNKLQLVTGAVAV